MTGRKCPSTSGPSCHHNASDAVQHLTPIYSSFLPKHHVLFPFCQQRAMQKWRASIYFDWRTILHNGPVLHICTASQKRDLSTIVVLWKGALIKTLPNVSICTVKLLQIGAQGDNASASPGKTMCFCYIKHFYMFVCLPGCVRQSCDWKLSRVLLPLWKNTSKSWPALANTIRYGVIGEDH